MRKPLIFFLLLSGTVLGRSSDGSNVTLADISYKKGSEYESQRCKLDVRYDEGETGNPVFVWFHGGGLTGGEKYFPKGLEDIDVVEVAVNYRLSPRVEVSDCIDDAAAAVAWVFENIEKYGGDPNQIVVAGHSAGGYLTLMLGLDDQWLSAYEVEANTIKALFPFSGHTITHFTERKAHGIPGTQAVVDRLAPLTYVRPDASPLYLMTGDREMELLGRYEENAYFWRMMRVVGHTDVHLYEFDGHDHGAMVTPGMHVVRSFFSDMEKSKEP